MADFTLVPQFGATTAIWADPPSETKPSRITTVDGVPPHYYRMRVGVPVRIAADPDGTPALVSAGAFVENSGAGTLQIPVVGQPGDLNFIHYVEEAAKISVPTGWVTVSSPALGGGAGKLYVLAKINPGFSSATVPVDVGAGGGARSIARMIAVKRHSGIPGSPVVTASGDPTTVTAPSMTAPSVGYTLALGFVGFDAGTTLGNFSGGLWAEVANGAAGPASTGIGFETVAGSFGVGGSTGGAASLANSTDWAMVGVKVGAWGLPGDPDSFLGSRPFSWWFAETPSGAPFFSSPPGISSILEFTPVVAGSYLLVAARPGGGRVGMHLRCE